MIELLCRTHEPPTQETSYWRWSDECLYVGDDRDEAQRVFSERVWGEYETAIWTETDRGRKVSQEAYAMGDNVDGGQNNV